MLYTVAAASGDGSRWLTFCCVIMGPPVHVEVLFGVWGRGRRAVGQPLRARASSGGIRLPRRDRCLAERLSVRLRWDPRGGKAVEFVEEERSARCQNGQRAVGVDGERRPRRRRGSYARVSAAPCWAVGFSLRPLDRARRSVRGSHATADGFGVLEFVQHRGGVVLDRDPTLSLVVGEQLVAPCSEAACTGAGRDLCGRADVGPADVGDGAIERPVRRLGRMRLRGTATGTRVCRGRAGRGRPAGSRRRRRRSVAAPDRLVCVARRPAPARRRCRRDNPGTLR